MSASSPIGPVVDQLADLALWEAELVTGTPQLAASLAERLARVPDPRSRQGLRHSLIVVLTLTACATLVVGNDSVTAIRQWAAGASQEVLARTGARYDWWARRYVVPSDRTFGRVLSAIDADILDGQVRGYLIDVVRGNTPAPELPTSHGPAEREQRRATRHPQPGGPLPAVALDGKLLRGSTNGPGQARTFLVAAIDHDHGTVLGQRRVANKRSERSAIEPLLTGLDLAGLDLAGTIVTMDALHTIRSTAKTITNRFHAHYILILKNNQKNALRAARALLCDPDTTPTERTHTDHDRGHGRSEQRTIHTAPTDDHLFPAARQVFRIHRLTHNLKGTLIRKETIHGVTSLPTTHATPADLNRYVRRHWHIENRLHWIRDVTFHEDASQLRTAAAPHTLATLRNLAISAYRLAGCANIAHARRELRTHADTLTFYGI